MLKWFKTLVAILLLPACVGGAQALGMVLRHSGDATTFWVAVLSGAACWVVIYLLMPKPMWLYVFGHELTHALWTWLFGGQVKKLKVSSRGGHVVVTRHNFLISLAPYFFPLYVMLVVAVYATGNFIWNWRAYGLWFHLLAGAAYAFHITLTGHILKTEQTDITEHGYVFSAVVIFLGNVALLLVGVPCLAGGTRVATALGWWWQCTWSICLYLARLR